MAELQNLQLHMATLSGKKCTEQDVIQNLPKVTQREKSVMVIVGSKGSGKTTLLEKMKMKERKCKYIEYCLKASDLKEKLELFLNQKDCGILLLDSFEKYTKSTKIDLVVVLLKLMSKIVSSGSASIVIATRYSGLNMLYTHLNRVHHHYCVEGFTEIEIKEFLTCVTNSERILKTLDENPVLMGMCKVPGICNELGRCILTMDRDFYNFTLTEIVICVILRLVNTELKGTLRADTINSFDSLPTEYKDGFKIVSKLAFEKKFLAKRFEDIESSTHFLSSFCLREGISCIGQIKTLDLVDVTDHLPGMTDLTNTTFWFVSEHVEEFLVGYYLQDLPPLDQILFLCEHAKDFIDSGYHGWLHYFYGLATQGSKHFKPTGMMINSINELLLHCLDMEKSLHAMVFLTCLVETKEKSYWRKLGHRKDKIFHITLSINEFKQARKGLIALVQFSGIKDWVMEAGKSHWEEAEKFKEEVKVEVNLSESKILEDDIRLMPRLDTSAAVEDRKFKSHVEGPLQNKSRFNHFSCRALREIMQRVLQLYSKPKLKGDSSNPSYLSFLSCDCLKEAMELHVSFDPVIPLHFLPVVGKLKKVMSENDQTAAHLKEKHNGDATELVIILQPTLRRMSFKMPGSSQYHDIEFSSEDLPEELWCFESMLSNMDDLEELVNCSRSQELFPSKCESMFPKLPIPTDHPELNVVIPETLKQKLGSSFGKKKDEDGTEEGLVKAREGESGSPMLESGDMTYGTSEIGRFGVNTESKAEKLLPQQQHRTKVGRASGGMIMVEATQDKTAGRVGGSLVMATSSDTKGFLKSGSSSGRYSQYHQQYHQAMKPPTAMRPGTVTYSVIQERLSMEKIHSLPDESSPVQVGGNGVILHGSLKGLDVAIKKTAYRTKEFNIMTKLHHSNVLRLLGFMWGEENPKHRRHYFAYHFYDLYHGDLARMVTDNRDMVLKQLYLQHSNDIAFMGRIRGNLSYLLSNILRGLAYLHSIHIAHRDFKASNVLIKFNCSCKNPLTCPCRDKCRVVICDFDAAIQMSDLDELPPTTILGSGKHIQSGDLYQCLLVGTTGFRAPECAFEINSNDPGAFSPPISCRCDIFSFGVFCLRFFIAEEGPRSQRVLATLLLGYHLQKSSVRRVVKSRRIDVPQETVDQILKIPKLREDMRWLKFSADFVASCLKVDPHERSSASMLLSHPFIRGDISTSYR